jgi:hypothetical protein
MTKSSWLSLPIGFAISVLVLGASLLWPGCRRYPSAADYDFSKGSKYVKVETSPISSEGSLRVIPGIGKNTSSRTLRMVQIQFTLFDKDGNQVGSAFAAAGDLEPGTTWKFSAPVFEATAANYKIGNILAR